MDLFWAQLAAPFALMVIFVIAWPIRVAVQKYMRDGWLKRRLLKRIDRDDTVFHRADAKLISWLHALRRR